MSAILEAEPRANPGSNGDFDQHVVIAANWARYERFLHARGADNQDLRLTYDRGRLEIMSISSTHDHARYTLGRIVDTVTEELNIPLRGQGETTIRRRDLDRGFEPDAWYYIQNASRVQGLDRELNFEIDPPPDLAIEIEISRSLLDRIELYASLGVREVWRFDVKTLRILVLRPDGTYLEQSRSVAIPILTATDLNRFVLEAAKENATTYFRQLRQWIRQNLVANATNPTAASS